MPGHHHIQIDPEISAVIHPLRGVPVALKDKIVDKLHRMEEQGVITRVNSMVTVVKPNKIRISIDPQVLKRAIKHEHYPLCTEEEVVASMPKAKVFSVLDANHGFWQIKLDEETSRLIHPSRGTDFFVYLLAYIQYQSFFKVPLRR